MVSFHFFLLQSYRQLTKHEIGLKRFSTKFCDSNNLIAQERRAGREAEVAAASNIDNFVRIIRISYLLPALLDHLLRVSCHIHKALLLPANGEKTYHNTKVIYFRIF